MVAPAIVWGIQGIAWGWRAWRGYRAATALAGGARAVAMAGARSNAGRAAANAARAGAATKSEGVCKDCDPKCPVCGKRGGKPPKEQPQWSKDNQVPPDNQTILNGDGFTRIPGKNAIYKGARGYTDAQGRVYYRDTFHGTNKGNPELEVFSSRKKNAEHLGTRCPACGADLGRKDPKKKLPEAFRK